MQTDKPTTIATAVALSCIGVFGILAAPIIQNSLQASLGLSAEQSGAVVAAEIFGGALASLLATVWINRVSWRMAAAFAIVVVVIVNVLSVLQTSASALAALRFCAGFAGQGTAFAIAIGIINSSSNHDRNFGFSIAAQVATGVITLLVLPPLAQQWGIKGVLLPLAGLAILVLPMVFWVPQGSGPSALDTSQAGESRPALPALLGLGIMLIWCTGLGGMWTFILSIGEAGGLDAAVAGRAIAISTAVSISGALAASALAARGGRLVPVGVALLIQIGAIAMLRGEMSFVQFALTAVLFQVAWNFTGPYLMGLIASNDQTGRLSVLIPAAQTGGFALGPALAGALMSAQGMVGANYVGIGGCLLALAIFIPTALRLQRQVV